MSKTCARCKQPKPRSAFHDTQELGYVRDGMGDGKHDACRDCVRERATMVESLTTGGRKIMQTQPYCLKDGWIRNSDTGKPVARVDKIAGLPCIIVFPGKTAIEVDNVRFILDQIGNMEQTNRDMARMAGA